MKGVVGEVINNTRSSSSRFPQDKYHKLVWKSTLKLIYFSIIILKPWGIVILIPHAYSNYRMSTERDYDYGSSLRIIFYYNNSQTDDHLILVKRVVQHSF